MANLPPVHTCAAIVLLTAGKEHVSSFYPYFHSGRAILPCRVTPPVILDKLRHELTKCQLVLPATEIALSKARSIIAGMRTFMGLLLLSSCVTAQDCVVATDAQGVVTALNSQPPGDVYICLDGPNTRYFFSPET
jgi:hypothetical protein